MRFFGEDGIDRALIVIDDPRGDVVEAWTGQQVETPLARGYDGAVAGIANRLYIWLPLCLLFLLPFVDPRRPLRVLHLDLLVLLGFGVSQVYFNRGEIGVSVPLVYPVLAYILVRMLFEGFRHDGQRERRDRLLPLVGSRFLIVAIALLAIFRIGVNLAEDNVIDVGYAGVFGADLLTDGKDVYGDNDWAESGIRGEVYGPVNYLAYAPFEAAFPYDGGWDELAAAKAAAIVFDLFTAAGLMLLGFRLRTGREGRLLGLALCFAWLAYPYTLYTLDSSFNDALVSATLVATLLAFTSAPGRGALSAIGGLSKYGTLALAPLFAAGDGERRGRDTLFFAGAFVVAAALVTLPLLPDGGFRELYDRSFGYQASRGSPFSLWGQDPSLKPLQEAVKVFAVLLALLVFIVPRRRSLVQICALGAAVIVALQLSATHWLYPYAVWFAPLVFVVLFTAYRGPEPATSGGPEPATSG